MTTVVAYAHGGRCIMAADSMTTVYDRPVATAVKVRHYPTTDGRGGYLLGFAGEGAGPAAVERNHTIESLPDFTDEADRNAWANAVAHAITEIYLEHALAEGGRMDSHLLLGAGGHVWTITHQQAIAHHDGIAAIGSGEGPAIGALRGLLNVGTDPLEAVRGACEIAISMDRYSGGESRLACLDHGAVPA